MIRSCRFDTTRGTELSPGVVFNRWLRVDVSPQAEGSVGGISVAPLATLSTFVQHDAERVLYVLDGEIELAQGSRVSRLRTGHLVYAPAGASIAFRGASSGARLIEVLAGHLSEKAPLENLANMKDTDDALLHVCGGDSERYIEVHRPQDGFEHMAAEFLVSEEICGARNLVIGRNRFDPHRGAHRLHRHAHAAEFMYPLSGAGIHLSTSAEAPLSTDQIDLVERNVWHGHANYGPVPFTGFFGFIGAGSRSAIGYEIWAGHAPSP